MGIAAPDTQLIFLSPYDDSRGILFYDKGIDAMMSLCRVCLGDDEVNGSGVAIGYPVLCSIQQVVIALVFCGRTLGGGVAAGFGFA